MIKRETNTKVEISKKNHFNLSETFIIILFIIIVVIFILFILFGIINYDFTESLK